MTAITPLETPAPISKVGQTTRYLRDLSIGSKLTVGFGTLVALMIVIVLISYSASNKAQTNFERTQDIRLPMALTSTIVEVAMYEMIGNIQSYLSGADPKFREEFYHDVEEVEELFASIDELAVGSTDQENQQRFDELKTKFSEWVPLTEQMFDLRDNRIANQPALKILLREARPAEFDVLTRMTALIEEQAQRRPSADNMRLLKTMADLRSSFNLMTTALDGYLASEDPSSKELFYIALSENDSAWEQLLEDRDLLTASQIGTLGWLTQSRNVFFSLPDRMITAVEGEHAREDLYILRTQAMPMAAEITGLLEEIREDQQTLLAQDVETVNSSLSAIQVQTLVGAGVSLLLAIALGWAIRRDIAGPVARLTHMTTLIRYGDLDARADVESRDEIGNLAESLNDMTDRLQNTLADAEQRSRIIAASSQVSRRLSTILNERQLVKEVVEQVRSAFDYYNVHVFILDEERQFLVTAGGVGAAGQELVARGFEIPLDTGLVGRAARTNTPILVADVSQHDEYYPNPLLPDTKSEIAVPVATGDDVLGVLDVQHNITGGLTQIDVDMLQSIANQVAIALRNARSYADTQRRVGREMLINEISQKILSTTSVDRAMQVAVRELGRAVGSQQTSIHLNTRRNNENGQS